MNSYSPSGLKQCGVYLGVRIFSLIFFSLPPSPPFLHFSFSSISRYYPCHRWWLWVLATSQFRLLGKERKYLWEKKKKKQRRPQTTANISSQHLAPLFFFIIFSLPERLKPAPMTFFFTQQLVYLQKCRRPTMTISINSGTNRHHSPSLPISPPIPHSSSLKATCNFR